MEQIRKSGERALARFHKPCLDGDVLVDLLPAETTGVHQHFSQRFLLLEEFLAGTLRKEAFEETEAGADLLARKLGRDGGFLEQWSGESQEAARRC
jgi:hypothetical protein